MVVASSAALGRKSAFGHAHDGSWNRRARGLFHTALVQNFVCVELVGKSAHDPSSERIRSSVDIEVWFCRDRQRCCHPLGVQCMTAGDSKVPVDAESWRTPRPSLGRHQVEAVELERSRLGHRFSGESFVEREM